MISKLSKDHIPLRNLIFPIREQVDIIFLEQFFIVCSHYKSKNSDLNENIEMKVTKDR